MPWLFLFASRLVSVQLLLSAGPTAFTITRTLFELIPKSTRSCFIASDTANTCVPNCKAMRSRALYNLTFQVLGIYPWHVDKLGNPLRRATGIPTMSAKYP